MNPNHHIHMKRAFSLLLCALLLGTTLPTTALATQPQVTESIVTDDATGNTTTTTTTVTQTGNGTSTEIIHVTVDTDGNILSKGGSTEGSDTVTAEKTEDLQDLTTTFEEQTPEQTITDSSETPDPVVSGDIKTDDTDPVYDQTTITETPRELTTTLTQAEVTVGSGEDIDHELGLDAVTPDWSGNEEDMNVWDETFSPNGEAPEGHDFYYSGYTGDSEFGIKYTAGDSTEYGDVVQFTLTDQNTGDTLAAYCLDLSTGTKQGWWYSVENLEDADYYSDDVADNIRAIVTNGYWGTSDGTGSLSRMKQTLKSAIAANPDALGGLTADDIDAMTDGEAQTATQMAIWVYGNQIDEEFTLTASNYNGENESTYTGDDAPTEENLAAWNRINQVSAYLAAQSKEESETTQVLTPDKFIDDIGLVVGSKVSDHENNTDDDDTNDAYHADLCFALEVTVTEDDDLIVTVVDAEGNPIRTARLAGDDSRTNYGMIRPDANGNYTISNLTLIEGDVSYTLQLQGAQYLREGVYIYTSEARDDATSQTFVGMANGYQAVDLSMNIGLNFNVQEGTVTTEHIWRNEWNESFVSPTPEVTPTPTPEVTPTPTPEVTPTPTPIPVSNIDNTSDVPKTGDESAPLLWTALLGASVISLYALKKRCKA